MRSRRFAFSLLRLSLDIFYVMLPMLLTSRPWSMCCPSASSPPSPRPPICVCSQHSIRTDDRPDTIVQSLIYPRLLAVNALTGYSPRATLSSSYPAPPLYVCASAELVIRCLH
ncbi:hypothetical protein K466DRAFT_24190 [Polyporus arcularius HHB13444]|uniref:Uncharacterized protein n=1 Tax=Polyporus arcularius HHB13444 TaxID=1314778 RepID=A0A5C3PTY2_9APHY|nr:hypothetical protein K466DRAFT_24190 [Polyporus arcularius HHB13444]